jgi:hypothetical protein
MSTWPPSVQDVKTDVGIDVDVDDTVLATELAAAVAYVRRVRKRFNYDHDATCDYPDPPDDLWLGTVRLAKRWHDRRRAAAGMVFAGDGGTDTVPYVDPDIERLLGIGRFRKAATA